MIPIPAPARMALSVDLEEYFQVEVMSGHIARSAWGAMPSRVEAAVECLLAMLQRARARATFFVVGWIAERFPGLVARLAAQGHEIGCHSHWHRPVFRLTAAEFRRDTRRAKAAIEAAAGGAIAGYRAPNFSLRGSGPQAMPWAFAVLAEAGFCYDSSVHPVWHPLYGAAGAPRRPWRVGDSGLWELPLATLACGRWRLPMAGGAYWRWAPLAYTQWGLRRVLEEGLRPICYVHPWEIDGGQPRQNLAWSGRLRHYHGIAGMSGKIERLLGEFGSAPIAQLYAGELSAGEPGSGRRDGRGAARAAERAA
ncbi:MAG: XrtA system polysaccharide deacetylase [Terriglobales bacterium]